MQNFSLWYHFRQVNLLFFRGKYGTMNMWLGIVFPRKVRNIQDPGFVPPPGFIGTHYLNNHRQTYSAVSGFNIVDSLFEAPHFILRRVVGGTNIQKGKYHP